MVGWLRARRIPIGLSLILLAFLVASGEILGSATSECQVEREPTLVALFVANTGGLTFYGQQLRSDCYIVVTYLMPNQSRYTLPGGYSSYFEAYVVIVGGRNRMYTTTNGYQLVRYHLLADCDAAISHARDFLARMSRLGLYTQSPTSFGSTFICTS